MESFEEYNNGCNKIAEIIWPISNNPIEYCDKLFQERESLFMELVDFRKNFVGEHEYLTNGGFLQIGYFNSSNKNERLTCYCVLSDITGYLYQHDFLRRFEPYAINQPAFVAETDLFNHIRVSENEGKPDYELISLNALQRIGESEIVLFNKSYFKTDVALNPFIVSWSQQNFNSENIYVRLNPYEVYTYQPTQRLYESIVHPANPNWWKTLSIHLRKHEGCSYNLDDCSPKENYNQHWEKHIKNVERLEIKANRGNDGLLSMLIEEVTAIDSHELMINRVIHMDTDAIYGTPFKEATLKHLDIAIYVYKDENAKLRNREDISMGIRSTEADYKCHLLRVDKLPFSSLFAFAISFLKSKTLINEWINDQFEESN